MKGVAVIIFILFHHHCSAQQGFRNFTHIDEYVRKIASPYPDSLALKLTAPFSTDLEKARAIFSWISQNIAYNTGLFASIKKHYSSRFGTDPLDTMTVWKRGEEMMAIRVLHRRITVCEGYSKLFKVLCDYAGLRSEIIVGYANGNPSRPGKFRSNHSWNAVMIDSVWHLVDPTWGSGYVDQRLEFVQETNDEYFLASPARFINDHFPEDLRWTLLDSPPPLREFKYAPFRYRSFDKYSIDPLRLGPGTIEAGLGDTVRIELVVKDHLKDKKISPDPFFDPDILESTNHSAFIHPKMKEGKIIYTYRITDATVKWLHLFYNDDLVLRFRLKAGREDEH